MAAASNTSLLSLPARFLTWWGSELREMLPFRPSGRLAAGKRRLVIAFEGDRRALLDERGGKVTRIDTAPSGDVDAMAQLRRRTLALSRSTRAPVGLRLPRDACLVRSLRFPVAVRDQLGRMLALDLERATPLKANDVLFGWTVTPAPGDGGKELMVEQVVAKRSAIEAAVAEAGGAGYEIEFIDGVRDGGISYGVNLLDSQTDAGAGTARGGALRSLLAVVLLILAGLGAWLFIARQQSALDSVDRQVEAARTAVAKASKGAGQAGGASKRLSELWALRDSRPLAIAVWNEVTRLLPDTAFATDLTIDGKALALSGAAQSAASLIGVLRASPLFSEVSLASPVIYDDALGLERFDIRATIVEQALEGQPQPAEASP